MTVGVAVKRVSEMPPGMASDSPARRSDRRARTSTHFPFGVDVARRTRDRNAVRTTRHQGGDGCGAASASRLRRLRSFFFMPTTERLLPPGLALLIGSLLLQPARVHGVGEAVKISAKVSPLVQSGSGTWIGNLISAAWWSLR